MKRLIYLDNAATTKTSPEVVTAMLPYFTEHYGNPSSVYGFASANKEVITKQREIIAGVLGAHQVSISKVVQKIITDGAAELVIVTDAVKEMAFGNALEDLKELEITREIGNVIREY